MEFSRLAYWNGCPSLLQEMQVQSLGREDPLEGQKWQPTLVFLPRESHGQRSLAGYSPPSGKDLDTTEQLTHTHTVQHH